MNTKTNPTSTLRQTIENQYLEELNALATHSKGQKPQNWKLSPQDVVTFIMGGKAQDGTPISAKYIGNQRLIETAVATLATDRALLLMGVPGTAKSWVSELLAAAITGDTTRVIQCTAGTDENQIRYGWNYAELLAHGPNEKALVPTPLMRSMQEGTLVRLEELTRMPSEVQDTLITILSEKLLPIPELNVSVHAQRGFNVIATANDRDKGVNELSSALKRRFNVVILPLPNSAEEENRIVLQRVKEIGLGLELPKIEPADQELLRVVTLFRELRDGLTTDGKTKLKSPSGNLSTAEAISVGVGGWSEAGFFGGGVLNAQSLAVHIAGAVIKDPIQDKLVLEEYLENVVRLRKDWKDLYSAIRDVI